MIKKKKKKKFMLFPPVLIETPKVKLLLSEKIAPPYCAKLFQNCVVPTNTMELVTT